MAVSTNKRKHEQANIIKTGVVNTKIKFGDDSDEETQPVNQRIVFDDDDRDESVAKAKPNLSKKGKKSQDKAEIGSKWYQEVNHY